MPHRRLWPGILFGVLIVLIAFHVILAAEQREWTPAGKPPETIPAPPTGPPEARKPAIFVETVVINPYKSANIGSRVGGVIDRFRFEEGDFIQEGQVVAELDPTTYKLAVQRSEERLRQLEVALTRAEEEARVKKELFELDATTRQEIIKAEAEAEITRFKVAEERKTLELARFDLESCEIKAPFSGYLAVRYKQPDETVERLEKVFALVDTSKVHAVANVPELMLDEFPKGKEAFFLLTPEKRFKGTVDRVGKLIDPKSRTKRVFLLINNSDNKLEVGMTGTMQLFK